MFNDVLIEAVLTAVTKPFALTVTTGICVAEPKLPTFELTVASVIAALTAALPSTELSVAVASPVKLKSLAVIHFVAVLALPVSAAVIVPAAKLPLASRRTSVEAVFEAVDAVIWSVKNLPPITTRLTALPAVSVPIPI